MYVSSLIHASLIFDPQSRIFNPCKSHLFVSGQLDFIRLQGVCVLVGVWLGGCQIGLCTGGVQRGGTPPTVAAATWGGVPGAGDISGPTAYNWGGYPPPGDNDDIGGVPGGRQTMTGFVR